MRCDDIIVNLPDHVLGKIEPNLKRTIEHHLEICPKCKAEYDEMKADIELIGRAGIEEYPDAFWQQMRASIMEKVSEPKRKPWRVPAFATGLAVVLIAVGIGIYQLSLRTTQRTQGPQSVAILATSLPSDQAVMLPQMNVNYVNALSSQASVTDEMDAVDDSVQEAVVRSLWASVDDSTTSLENYLLSGNSISN